MKPEAGDSRDSKYRPFLKIRIRTRHYIYIYQFHIKYTQASTSVRERARAATDARVTRGCHESEKRVHERACVYSSAQSKHFPRLPLNNSTMPNTYVAGISPEKRRCGDDHRTFLADYWSRRDARIYDNRHGRGNDMRVLFETLFRGYCSIRCPASVEARAMASGCSLPLVRWIRVRRTQSFSYFPARH